MQFLLLLGVGQLAAAGALWATTPADASDIIRQAYPLGNGRLGVMPFGEAGSEKLNLNIDTLWSGGPFELEGYNGGNPNGSMVDTLNDIRSSIWFNGTGNDTQLFGDISGYGSFKAAGNLSVFIDGIDATSGSYNRSLDLFSGLHTTTYEFNDTTITTTVYCSYPDQVCVYSVASSQTLPQVSILLENQVTSNPDGLNLTCGSDYARLTGLTQNSDPVGMKLDIIARSSTSGVCDSSSGTLVVSASNSTSLTIVIGAGTDYDQTKGTSVENYSFRGDDPSSYVEEVTAAAIKIPEPDLRSAHISDYSSLSGAFTLNLPDTQGSTRTELAKVMDGYNSSLTEGNPFLEKLMFDYGRHLLISSSRANSLPPNLQGVWSEQDSAAWSGDYHANINLQMNMWPAEQTGLGDVLVSVWNMMSNTWVPRGTETAELLYGADGWVTHNEMNIFGHTGMKDWPTSSDYAIAPAWMMQHVWDHFDYSQDVDWWQQQGWPLLKGTAEFWLSQLQADAYYNDSSLVVNPCTSPEHGPVTFACAHWQQLIYQVFESTLAGGDAAGETDEAFLADVTTKLAALDKGLHIGTHGEIKEWKAPESVYEDSEIYQHRHLSHLVGWYPGWSIPSFQGGYTNETIQRAVNITLTDRGTGHADGDAGWSKAWRSACWARLNNSDEAYYEFRYTIDENFGSNGLSMYTGDGTTEPSPPFQIDANFGIVGAVLSMLVVDMPLASGSQEERTVVLGPAIPAAWAGGSVQGLRIRGGGSVGFSWDERGVVNNVSAKGLSENVRLVNVEGLMFD
ncbi:Uu.00g082880.m01.CDS01 [Anthostomella pinea]|uniref:Uu.00g082880.m01.CDS01 n=1 Tax=Anthostomella pinea TaxID=933095 RepID=A0AAI8VM31_9PEZI|nr:Uu.00g082880.m01.CDS01 [Anthostomella pinea]